MAKRVLPTVRLRRLAAELRDLRAQAGLSREAVEERSAINQATLYRIESARTRPQRRTLLALLDLYGVRDEERRAQLVELSRSASQLGWLQAYQDLPEPYSALISLEQDAKNIQTYESTIIPGLLQTEAYAQAVIAGIDPTVTPEEVQQLTQVRMQRQQLLDSDHPPTYWGILDQATLARTVGGEKVMQEQIARLLDLARRPTVTLQVVPFAAGAHTGMTGSFVVLGFEEDPEIVYLDTAANQIFLEQPADIARYTKSFEFLRAAALSPAETIKLLRTEREKS